MAPKRSQGVRKFFILAGEASGDRHGAALMEAIQSLEPAAEFSGIGGEMMQAAGFETLYDTRQMAVVGFSEVLRKLRFLRRAMRQVMRHITSQRPERIILIDYPGFNLRLAKRLRRSGIPITYYISPQLWAWREGRIRVIRRCVEQMLVIFPFEEEWYRERGIAATFVGHPILDEPAPDQDRETFLAAQGLRPDQPLLTLYPGSREDELEQHLGLFFEAARMAREACPGLQLALGLAPDLSPERIPAEIRQQLHLVTDRPRMLLRYADVAMVASGTATLEAAAWGVPMVVVYRVSAFTAWLGRRLLRLPHVSMANILAGRELVPEFLQERAQPGPIARFVVRLLKDDDARRQFREDLLALRQMLKPPETGNAGTVSLRAAQIILGPDGRSL